MINTKKLLVATTLTAAALVLPMSASASGQYSTPEQPRSKIMINKWVFDPSSNSYVDNLSINQHQFLPGQEVKFKIQVKNTGDKDLWNIEVSDKLPWELDFVSGTGNFDKNSNTLKFTDGGLKPNESHDYEVRAKIKGAESIKTNTTCPTNLAEAKVENMIDQDTAQFCITKQVLGVTKELPKTGVTGPQIALLSTVISSALAITFARKSRKVA